MLKIDFCPSSCNAAGYRAFCFTGPANRPQPLVTLQSPCSSWSESRRGPAGGAAKLAHCRRWTAAALRMSLAVRGELGFKASRSIRRLLGKQRQDRCWNLLEAPNHPALLTVRSTQRGILPCAKTLFFVVLEPFSPRDTLGMQLQCLSGSGTS